MNWFELKWTELRKQNSRLNDRVQNILTRFPRFSYTDVVFVLMLVLKETANVKMMMEFKLENLVKELYELSI